MAKKDNNQYYVGCVDCNEGGKDKTPAQKDAFMKAEKAKGHRAYEGMQLHGKKSR